MNEEKIDSSVNAFRAFINKHPGLRTELRKSGRPWQEYYEKWTLLGEDDPYWEDYKQTGINNTNENDEQEDMMERFIKFTDNIDVEKLEKQVQQFNQTIQLVQGFLTNKSVDNTEQKQESQSRNIFKLFQD